ncbi:MAG TPA: metallophosphoesterase family protein [Dehalococcoidia bacterium]|nr:metallophosphoesterase family protein [Dehalococcoidia bacterium]
MLIGLISDTHLARPEEELPSQLETAFEGVELILHAGDIWIPSALDQLESIAPVMAAWGDDDMESDLGDDPRMLDEQAVYIDGVTLWLVHEKPAFGTIVPRENTIFSRNKESEREIPEAVIYGHTHKALIEKHKGVLVINPGSPTWPNNFPELGTVGILSIESGKVNARIIQLV